MVELNAAAIGSFAFVAGLKITTIIHNYHQMSQLHQNRLPHSLCIHCRKVDVVLTKTVMVTDSDPQVILQVVEVGVIHGADEL